MTPMSQRKISESNNTMFNLCEFKLTLLKGNKIVFPHKIQFQFRGSIGKNIRYGFDLFSSRLYLTKNL